MYEYASAVPKVAATGIIAVLTAFWGWCGWLWLFWIFCMAADYLTGTIAACRVGTWSSDAARRGISGKLGSVVVVLVTAALDFVMGQVVNSYALPFTYGAVLSPIVLAWYVLTEIGSILENASRLGAPLPPFLLRWIAKAAARLEDEIE